MSQEKYLEQLSSHSRYIVKQLPVIKTLKHNDNLNSNRRSYTWALFGRLILQFFHGFTVRYFSFPFIYEKLVNSLPPNVTLYSQSNSKNKRENHLYKLKAPSALYFQILWILLCSFHFMAAPKKSNSESVFPSTMTNTNNREAILAPKPLHLIKLLKIVILIIMVCL